MDKNLKDITIIADDREQKSEVIKTLSNITAVSVKVQRLAVGDYLVDDRILFERKTLSDFVTSIIDGRLFTQAVRLASSDYKGVLILEGTGKDLSQTGVRREALQGALITISLILGIPVLRAVHQQETAYLMVYAARQLKNIAKGSLQKHGYRPKTKKQKQVYLLQGLPGIGRQRAARLLEAFGSVEAVITASCEELQSIDGIGTGIAEKIRWMVSEKLSNYGDCNNFFI